MTDPTTETTEVEVGGVEVPEVGEVEVEAVEEPQTPQPEEEPVHPYTMPPVEGGDSSDDGGSKEELEEDADGS
jgi:hypothetical protein